MHEVQNMSISTLLSILYVFTINQILCGPDDADAAEPPAPDCPVGFNEVSQFHLTACYVEIEETTFPYHCPLRYTEYLVPFSLLAWLNVRRDTAHGFFPFPILSPLHGHLLWPLVDMPSDDFEDCIIGNSQSTANCNDKHKALCIYDKTDRQFCEAYDEICNASDHNCHCQSKNILYMCQAMCKPSNHQECSSCDERFAQYPEPEIHLVFNGIGVFIVDVIGPLKLISVLYTDVPIYCFSNVYTPDPITIRHRILPSRLDAESKTKWRYVFSVQILAVGLYWCEGITYESHKKVVSNTIMAGVRSAFGLNFIINATTNEFTLTPYTLHTETILNLRSILRNFNDKVQLIRLPELPHLHKNRSTADLSYHLTTFPQITNAEYEFNELVSKVLPDCESIGLRNCSVALSDLCLPAVTIIEPGLTASWPKALLGQPIMPREILLQENGLPITRRCLGGFMTGAFWSHVNGKVSARRGSSITETLYELTNSNQTAEELNQKLRDVILNVEDLIPLDVYLVANIFEIIAQSGEDFNVNVFVENMNVIMDSDSNILQLAQNELNATDIILYSFDIALATLAGNTTTTIVSKNIMAQVTPLAKSGGITGIAVYHQKDQLQMENLTNVTSSSDIDFDGLQLAVFIPPELLRQIFAQALTPSLVTTVFFNDALFRSDKNVGVSATNAVVGVFVTNFVGVHLSEPLPIIFASSSLAGENMFCGHWKFGINDVLVAIHGSWQKEELAKIYYGQFKACSFNHMTHFAILANAPRNRILDIISLVGCAISMLGVIGIMVTAMVFKSWRNCTATKILLNLSLTILIQMSLLFLSHVMSTTHWCTILAISLHYIIVSQFSWMLVIGYLQYRKFVQVLVEEPARLVLCSSIFAWVTPILPVAIVFFLDKNSYMNPPYCFLTGQSLYFGVFLPIGCVVVSNLTIFMLIFASLSCSKARAFGTGENTLLLRVRLSFILFFLLGFSWIFGLLSYITKSIILSYLFCVMSTIQGLVLYIYFVVCNKHTRTFWTRNIFCCSKTTSKTESPFISKSK